jgi:hypothetical protein
MSAKWIVYLSDGQVVKSDELEEIDSSKTAWLQLMDYLRDKVELEIRSIQLVINGVVYNTPSISKRASVVSDGDPCRFWCFQKVGRLIYGGADVDHWYGLSYRVGEYRHYTWVNTQTNETYSEVHSILNQRESTIEKFYDDRK